MTIIDATERGIAMPTPALLVASFSPMPPNEGNPPLKVQFSDYSQGTITGWNWSFGDGSLSSERYPVHTYRVNGTYNVTLTVSGPSGTDTFTSRDASRSVPGHRLHSSAPIPSVPITHLSRSPSTIIPWGTSRGGSGPSATELPRQNKTRCIPTRNRGTTQWD